MSWFPDKDNPELERLADIIFVLRRRLFRHEKFFPAHEREWESDEQEKRRERQTEEALMEWDNETRRLILGE